MGEMLSRSTQRLRARAPVCRRSGGHAVGIRAHGSHPRGVHFRPQLSNFVRGVLFTCYAEPVCGACEAVAAWVRRLLHPYDPSVS